MKKQLDAWEVKGFWPGEPLWTKSVESTVQRRGVTPWMPVSVPGGVHGALERAGLILDPYYAMNSLLCEWVEHRWWVYRTLFDAPETDGRVFLRFGGIDDRCRIFLNGEQIAEHSGIYEPVLCEVTQRLRRDGPNQLLVILTEPPQEQGQIGWTSRTFTQKARFGYKWDFCTRLVNIGLWQPVWLETCGPARISHVSVTSDVRDGLGIVRVGAELEGECGGAVIRLARVGQTVSAQHVIPGCRWNGKLEALLTVPDPELWYPNTMGGQPLYDVEIALDGGSDSWSGRTGIRSLDYARCDGAGLEALPYCPVINGRRVYIRGVNLTPLDMRYGDVTEAAYRRLFVKLRHMHVNTLRVWGGGIIETETFYRLADEFGMLVWQEFIQSSSGIDNVPCHDPAYLDLLGRSSRAAVLARRNHVSLTWWSGGNELADAQFRPVTAGDPNIAMLSALVRELDPQRLFLPSSPSGPSFGLDDPQAGHHDVHGNWQYDGITGHYEKYNRSDSMLQSEFGADGMSSPDQLRRILPESDLGVFTMKDHPALRHHGEWWETLLYRDRPLFGEIADIAQWTAVSQMMQSEAIRYIVLSNRRRRGQNGGSIIWQMNEPYPNVTCTSLTEYYGRVKGAYYAVRRAYAPVCVGLRYDGMLQEAGRDTVLTAWADALTDCPGGVLSLTAYSLQGDILFETRRPMAFQAGRMSMEAAFPVARQAAGLWLARVALDTDGQGRYEETFVFAQDAATPLRPLMLMPPARVAVSRQENCLALQNMDMFAAVWLRVENPDDPEALLSDNDITLLPGEQRILTELEGPVGGWRVTDLAGRVLCGG